MSRAVCCALAIVMAASGLSFGQSDDDLHPAFVDESLRDPFLQPAAQISGPLDGEDPSDQWDLDRVQQHYAPAYLPGDVFADDDGSCVDTTPATPKRRVPFMDSGITATYLSPVDGFGVSDVDLKTQLIIPVFVKGSPLRVAMAAGTTFISAPAALDVPNRLYGLTAELRWYIPLKETWGVDLGAGGGVFSDLNGTAGEGFRVTGRAILVKDLNPRWKVSAGVLYLGRKNLLAMPVAGLIYTPQDDLKVELLIPRPRVMKRISVNGTRENWVYAGAEIFGGNTWAVQQTSGAQDTFIYSDNRLLVGYETRAPNGIAGRLEAGYVFMRKVHFSNSTASLDPGGTVMVRAGVTY